MAALNPASRRFGHHSRLLASSAPLALAIAIGAGPASGQQARPVNIPFPTAVNPANGLRPNWTHVTTDAGYDPHYTTGSVTQTAPRAYAEWESFNVTPGSTWTVNGQQPDWILVDRVVGVNGVIPASSLSGMIAANGQVWILNTSGIAVSKTGVFDVAGLLLSTAASFNLTGDGAATPGSFLGGSLAFQFGGAANSVVMDGTVNASKGIVAFLAPQVTVGGKVVQTAGGSTQFAAVAAQDVSLVFTDVGTVLALDGVTISAPAPVQCINVCPPPPHSTVDLQAGSQITAGRIFVAGAAVGSPAAIIASGGLTATAARGDGQDIVLMAADNVVAGMAPSAELAGGAVQASATTTTTGGSVTIDTALVNTTAAGVEDPAAAVGAGLMIRSAGDTDVGGITNAAGDIDILARGNINPLTSGGGNMAGVDIALDGGTVTVGALTAGDDVAVRAAQFSATSIASGQSVAGQAPVDTIGAADRLIASAGAFTLAGVYYDLTGHDIDIIAPAGIAVTGPITAAPATSGFLSSDVRLEALDGVSVANITADRDILVIAGLRAGSVTGGAFTAGRDVAVWVHPGAGSIALASAEAGDDIVLRSPTAITVTGGLTTQGLDVSPAVAGDQAGDLLSSLLPMTAFGHAFTVSPGSQVDLIAGTTIDIGAAATAAGPNSSARFQAKDGVTVGAVTAGADVLIDADLTDADSGAAAGAVAKGALSAGRDIAVRSTNADISLLSATAGDDIVLRSTLAIDVTGALATQGLDVSPATAADQAGDLLSAADPITAFGHVFDLTGSDIDVKSGAGGTNGVISIGGQIAAAGAQSDVRLQADNAITVAGVSAGRDILIDGDLTDGNGDQGSGVTGGALVAGRDVGVRSLNNSVTLASAQAGDDIVLRSPTASITVNGTLAAGGVDVTPASSADQAGDLLSALDPMTAFGFKFAASPGSEIDVLAATTISVGGQSSGAGAQSDARFQANDAIALGGVSVGRDILIDGDLTDAGAPAGVTAGALVAGRDIAVQSPDSAVTLASAQSGDHLVLRAVGAIDITGALTTGGANAAATADQAGDLLVASDPMVAFGHTFALSGSDIDVVAGGAITVGGPAAAAGALSDARFQTANGVTLAAVNAGADVLVDGGGAVVGGALVAGRDVGVRSLGFSIVLASAQAGDDIVLRAPTAISVTGALTTNGQDVSPKTSPDQAGDLLAALDPLNAFGATFPVSPGSDIDVVAGDGVKIAGQVAAAGSQSDARFQGPIVTLAGITAGEDVLVDGGLFATVGAVSAGRDVGIAAGADLTLASAQAGDDIVLRAADNLTVTGSLTTLGQDAPVSKAANQAGDLLAAFEPMTAFGASFAVSPGSDIDVVAGFPITVGGQVTAGGPKSSARFQSGYGVSLAGVTAGQDILIDADSSDLEGGTPTGVITAALIAGRDIGIRSQLSSITLASAQAGDDIVLRSPSTIGVTSSLATTGPDSTPAVSPDQAGDLLSALDPMKAFGATFSVSPGSDIDVVAGGAITVGGAVTAAGALSDARFQSPLAVTLAGVNAGEDLLVDGGGAVIGGIMVAGRDIAVRSLDSSLALTSAQAGDDIVLRSATSIGVTGTLASQGLDTTGTTTPDQAGVLLATLDPMVAFGHTFTLTGSDIDAVAGTTISVGGSTTGTGALADARFQASDGITVGGVSVGRDILIDADLADAGAPAGVTAGALIAGRDIAAQSVKGSLAFTSAQAGDDIVLRSATSLGVTGALTTKGPDVTPATSPDQAGDLLAAADPLKAFGATFSVSPGSDIDVVAGGAITVGGAVTAAGALSDARFQSPLAVTLAGVNAGEDLLVDGGGAVIGGIMVAGRDIAVRSLDSSLALISAQAGDDIVLRSATSVGVTGTLGSQGLDTTGTTTPDQAGVLLATLDPMVAFGHTFTLGGSDIDVVAGTTITVGGQTTGTGTLADARFQANDAITLGGVTVGRDILIDGDLADSVGPFGIGAGALVAGRDIAIQSVKGALAIASAQADDHLVLRAAGAVDVTGALTTGGVTAAPTADQAGDLLVASDPMVAFGHTFALSGSDIDVVAGGAITVGGAATATGAQSDARFQSPLGVTLAGVNAGEDVLIDAAGALAAGAVVAGRDVAIRSSDSAITLTSAQAGDDIVLRSVTSTTVTGTLTSQGLDTAGTTTADQAGVLLATLEPMVAFGYTFGLSGSDIDAVAGTTIEVGGATTGTGVLADARFQASDGVTVGAATVGRDILIDADLTDAVTPAGVTAGALVAGRDIAIQSVKGALALTSATAGDDIVLRSATSLGVTGALTTKGPDVTPATSPDQSGDLLAAADPMKAFGATFSVSPGPDIDVVAGGAITVDGAATAAGALSDARFQSPLSVTLAGVNAGEDLLVDGGGAVIGGAVVAGRDIAVRSLDSSISLGSAQAADDIVLRSATATTVTGALTTLGPNVTPTVAPDQAGDLLAALAPMKAFGATFAVSPGSDIDVIAGGAITVGGQTTTAGVLSDVRFQSPLGVTLAGVTAGDDVLVDGGGAVIGGAVVAGRDIAVRSLDSSIALASAQAGDDVVLRSATSIGVSGTLTSQGLDTAGTIAPNQAGALLAAHDPMTAFGHAFSLSGSDIDVVAGTTITVGGQTTGTGVLADARFQASDGITVRGVIVGRDILIDADLTDAGPGAGVNAGALSAGRDIGIQSVKGSITLASAQAGDDIVLRSPSAISVTGALATGGVDASPTATPDQAGDLLAALAPMTAFGATFSVSPGSDIDVVAGGAIMVGGQTTAAGALSDVRFQSPLGVTLADVTASEDVLVDGGGAVAAGAVVAARDVGIRSLDSSITLASAQAGDDIVLRAPSTVTITGGAASGQGAAPATSAGAAGDLLAALDPIMTYWAATPAAYSTAGGHDVDIRSGGSITVGGAMTANGAGSDVRLDAFGAGATVSVDSITLSGGAGHEQILVAATDFGLSGNIDAPLADVLLFARQSGALAPATLGGPATGLGGAFTFDNAEVGRTAAASLNLFSGTAAGDSADVAVQDLNLTAGLRTVRVFAGAGARIEVFGQVVDGGGGGATLDIGTAATDPTLPRFSQDGAQAVMSSFWTPDVVRISGGIGVTGSPFADVALAGQSIFIAPRNDAALGVDFEQAVAKPVNLADMATYAGGAKLQISSGTLELRTSTEVLERNLQTGATEFGEGLEIGRLTIDRLTAGGPSATRVNLYGEIDKNLAGVIPPANPNDLIGGILPAIILHFEPFPIPAVLYPAPSLAVSQAYKWNNCVFGGGGCLAEEFPPTEPGNLPGILPFIPHPDDIGNVSDPYTPVEEEPVTNVGGEVEWLPATSLAPACPNGRLRQCDTEPAAGPSPEAK